MGLLLCGTALGGVYSGGTGSPETPYQIGSVNDWLELIGATSDWDKHFEVIADIDFAGAALTPVASAVLGNDGTIIGVPFSGTVEGNGHTMRNATLLLPDNDYVGLFGYCTGTLQNLTLQNISVSGDWCVGLLTGWAGTISNCHVQGNVSGGIKAGLLAGHSGSISDCTSNGTVTILREQGGGAGRQQ